MRVQIYAFCWIFLLLAGMSLYTMIGVMSGTSMDGLDITLCEIKNINDDSYEHKTLNSKTFSYPSELFDLLVSAKSLPADQLFALDKLLGKHYAACINSFLLTSEIDAAKVDAIASHGHTVHHQPENGFTVQIGCGITMAKETGIRVINDFRQKDVVFGGQGAPLVPIGDKLLFANRADAYLNIGGFTNISIPGDVTIAFDISPGNLPLNAIAQELGVPFDDGGAIARKGTVDLKTLRELNALPYYTQPTPKSLGTEWLEAVFLPVLNQIPRPEDRMRTCVTHIAEQISAICVRHNIEQLFVTGGGAFNAFLLEELHRNAVRFVLPEKDEIDFKEALIFAFLGVRFLEGKYNCLASVTGASTNVCGGTLHLP